MCRRRCVAVAAGGDYPGVGAGSSWIAGAGAMVGAGCGCGDCGGVANPHVQDISR